MKENIPIKLPEKISSDLRRIAKDEDLTRSQIVRDALQDYIIINKFRAL